MKARVTAKFAKFSLPAARLDIEGDGQRWPRIGQLYVFQLVAVEAGKSGVVITGPDRLLSTSN